MDIHKIIEYLQQHWLVISMVYFPAFLGYLNAFVASCKVMGWTKLADELGKIENALKTFFDTLKNQKQQSNVIMTGNPGSTENEK